MVISLTMVKTPNSLYTIQEEKEENTIIKGQLFAHHQLYILRKTTQKHTRLSTLENLKV